MPYRCLLAFQLMATTTSLLVYFWARGILRAPTSDRFAGDVFGILLVGLLAGILTFVCLCAHILSSLVRDNASAATTHHLFNVGLVAVTAYVVAFLIVAYKIELFSINPVVKLVGTVFGAGCLSLLIETMKRNAWDARLPFPNVVLTFGIQGAATFLPIYASICLA